MAYDGLDDPYLSSVGPPDAFADDHWGSGPGTSGTMTKESAGQINPHPSSSSASSYQSVFPSEKDLRIFVPVRQGVNSWPPGLQPTLVCRLGVPGLNLDTAPSATSDFSFSGLIPPPSITAICLNSAYSLLAIGNDFGIAVVDYTSKTCILSVSSVDLFGCSDPYPRITNRSPGRATSTNPTADLKNVDQPNGTSVSNQGNISVLSKSPQSSTELAQAFEAGAVSGRLALSRAAAVKGELKRAKSQVVLACRTSQSQRHHGQNPYQHSICSEKCSDVTSLSHSCSLSTSTSSMELMTNESIRTIVFMESHVRKPDTTSSPSLWIGTSRGCVLSLNLKLPNHLGSIFTSGSLYRLRGDIIYLGFLDLTGDLIQNQSEKWDDSSSRPRPTENLPKQMSSTSSSSVCSGTISSAQPSGETDSGFRSGDMANASKRLGTGAPTKSHRDPISKQSTVTTQSSSTSSSSGHSSTVVSSPLSPTGQHSLATTCDSPTGPKGLTDADRQLVVFCSEKQARVVALPSQTCLYKVKITETSQVVRANIQRLKPPAQSCGNTCFLACYLANGHFVAFSLPSLRLLMDVDYLPYTECVVRSFSFGQHGQAIYLTSPSELLKVTWSADVCANLRDMQGELFLPCNMPEPPKKSFFKNLLTGNLVSSLDRDELFSEATSGKGTPGATTLLPNARMEKLTGQSSGAASEIARARQAAIERGERLQQLDLQTQEMADQSKAFGRSAALIAAKYEKKDKRWGWPL